jgi:hypothetical protein
MEKTFDLVLKELGLDPESATKFMEEVSEAGQGSKFGDVAFIELLRNKGIIGADSESFYDGLFYKIYKKSQEHSR